MDNVTQNAAQSVTSNSDVAEVVFINGNNFGFDEFFCFGITDFKVGDAIEYLSNLEGSKHPVRMRGVVTRVSKKDLRIFFRTPQESVSSVHINDVTFLSEGRRGWLSGAKIA